MNFSFIRSKFISFSLSKFLYQIFINYATVNRESGNMSKILITPAYFTLSQEVIMTRKEQKEFRKQQILDTALTLFVQQGYYGTKTSQISKQAGISEGLLFHYFPTKEKLLEELVTFGVTGMQMPMELQAENGLDFFRKFAMGLFSYVKENPFIARMFVFMAHMAKAQDIPERIRKMAVSVDTIQNSCIWIQEGQKDGTIRAGDPLCLSNLYWCCIHGLMEQYSVNPDIPLPEPEWLIGMLRAK